jgi:phage terminase small subunit
MADDTQSRKFTDKETRFIEEYLVDLNATAAAKRAGYSETSAHTIGWENLKKPEIRKVIDDRLSELSLSAKEVTKLTADIAKASLNDYFITKKVLQSTTIEKTLGEVMDDLWNEIEDEETYVQRRLEKGTVPKSELEMHAAAQESRRNQMLRMQIELERNPQAMRIVQGPSEWVEVSELDLPRLVKDKKAGRIKSVKHSEHGLNVELYAADAALDKLARIHGLYKDNVVLGVEDELKNLYKKAMLRSEK